MSNSNVRREEPALELIPSEAPSSGDGDREGRVQALVESPAYRRADADMDFLQRDELRSTRMQLEYLKPELSMQDRGIESTIVLLGGARIVARDEALVRRDAALAEAEARPSDPRAQQRLRAAEQLVVLSRYHDVAREFAGLASRDCSAGTDAYEFAITTGGGAGIMEAGNRGAYEAGAPSIGLNIKLPFEQPPNPYISPDLCFQFGYFSLRKMHFMLRAKALVAFPGGYETFDELLDALCLVQTRRMDPIPIVLVGRAFWRRAFDVEFLVEQGTIAPEDAELFTVVETADEIWDAIRAWHRLD